MAVSRSSRAGKAGIEAGADCRLPRRMPAGWSLAGPLKDATGSGSGQAPCLLGSTSFSCQWVNTFQLPVARALSAAMLPSATSPADVQPGHRLAGIPDTAAMWMQELPQRLREAQGAVLELRRREQLLQAATGLLHTLRSTVRTTLASCSVRVKLYLGCCADQALA